MRESFHPLVGQWFAERFSRATEPQTQAWPLIRAAAGSVAEISIFPVQDLLEFGSDARMNTPAVPDGNWSWRVPEGSWTPQLAKKLSALVEVTDRDNDPVEEQGTRERGNRD